MSPSGRISARPALRRLARHPVDGGGRLVLRDRQPAGRAAPPRARRRRRGPFRSGRRPTPALLRARAMLRSSTSPEGRCRPGAIARSSASSRPAPSSEMRRPRVRPHAGQSRRAPCSASRTGSGTAPSSQRARPVDEARRDVLDDEDRHRKVGGNRRRARAASACGPPVEAQIADHGAAAAPARLVRRRGRSGRPRGWRITRAPLSSLTRRRKRDRRRAVGVAQRRARPWRSRRARRRRAPRRRARASALTVPESTRIGVGRALMICSTASRPDMPGSSRSIVTRSGLSARQIGDRCLGGRRRRRRPRSRRRARAGASSAAA